MVATSATYSWAVPLGDSSSGSAATATATTSSSDSPSWSSRLSSLMTTPTKSRPSSTSASLPTPDSTPTRASRTKGVTNEIEYLAFTRQSGKEAEKTTTTFKIGDCVLIGADAQLGQKWLQTPPHLLNKQKSRTNYYKKKQRTTTPHTPTKEQQQENHWYHEDGLEANEKVGVITRLFEDVQGKQWAQVRWLARPGAIWNASGPDEGDEVLPYELYYSSDSRFLEECAQRQATLQAQGKSYTTYRSQSDRTPQCSDPVLLSTIKEHVSISGYNDQEKLPLASSISNQKSNGSQMSAPASARPPLHFIVRKVYDVKPVRGAEFMGDINWMEVYENGLNEGDWNVEPTFDPSSEQLEAENIETDVKKRRKENIKILKRTKVKRRKNNRESEVEGAADETSDDSSSGGEDSYQDGNDSEEQSEQEEDDNDPSDDDLTNSTKQSKRSKRSFKTKPKVIRRIVPRATKTAKERAIMIRAKQSRLKAKQRGLIGLPPPLAFTKDVAFAELSVFGQAKALLHVSATPESLPRRDDQRMDIYEALSSSILNRTGTCLYIHGVPGTGKTATVHSVVRELQQEEEMEAFQFVEINGMKISEPNTAYSLLWEALSREKRPARQALGSLEAHFQTPDPARPTTVVLVDELDQMITKKQDVVYNFFNWPHFAHSRLTVIAIANTMDLPERELSGKILSRLGHNRIPFPSYGWQDLLAIVESRLEGLDVFGPRALEKICRSVANVSGDARRALDIARRTVEKVDQANQITGAEPRLCSLEDVTETYKEMTHYGSNLFVRRASLHHKIFLLALSQSIKRSGLMEVEMGTVIQWHLDFLRQTTLEPVPSHTDIFTFAAELHNLRLVVTETQRSDYFQRVRNLVEDSDLFQVLRDEPLLRNHVPRVS